jgi:hypothetical protein
VAESLITVKTSKDVLRLLRVVAAVTGEKQYEVLTRLLRNEMARLKKEKAV